MLVILLVIAGVAFAAALAVIGYLYFGGSTLNQPAVQRHLVRQEQRLAEARMQRAMQDTINEMFRAAREPR
ncbi:hypothetical protein [uncultured Jatrophihabitans sp.]|uniref:hypothetical protein n=1 Tax=uncultured Jatrophihabitans sp. TaxID=1610747 RepID=UPI0035CB921C